MSLPLQDFGTKRKKKYLEEFYYSLIEETKKQYGDLIFRELPDLFLSMCEALDNDSISRNWSHLIANKRHSRQIQTKALTEIYQARGNEPIAMQEIQRLMKEKFPEITAASVVGINQILKGYGLCELVKKGGTVTIWRGKFANK